MKSRTSLEIILTTDPAIEVAASSRLLTARSLGLFFLICTVLLVGVVASLSVGAAQISFQDVVQWASGEGGLTQVQEAILGRSRLPRLIVALLVGVNLAVSGLLLQLVTRNPLADPGLIGVTAGAGLAATIVLALYPKAASILPFAAFSGALVSSIIVYGVSWRPGAGTSPIRMILAGVAVNAILGAVIGFLMTAYSDRIPSMMFWTSGSFNGRSWNHFDLIWPYSLIGVIASIWLIPKLKILEMGEDTATSLGVDVGRTRLLTFVTAALLAGSAASVAGLVGFVGLVVPHLVRLLVGRSIVLLPACALGGACLLVWSDVAARAILPPSEIAVGVITGLLGGPYFVYLLYKSRWLQ